MFLCLKTKGPSPWIIIRVYLGFTWRAPKVSSLFSRKQEQLRTRTSDWSYCLWWSDLGIDMSLGDFPWLLKVNCASLGVCATEMASLFKAGFLSLSLSLGDGSLFIFWSCLCRLTAELSAANNCSSFSSRSLRVPPLFLQINIAIIARFQLSASATPPLFSIFLFYL